MIIFRTVIYRVLHLSTCDIFKPLHIASICTATMISNTQLILSDLSVEMRNYAVEETPLAQDAQDIQHVQMGNPRHVYLVQWYLILGCCVKDCSLSYI